MRSQINHCLIQSSKLKIKMQFAVFFLVVVTCSLTAQRGVRIGYIDTEYILQNVSEYQQAQTQLENKAQKWKAEIDQRTAALENKKQQLNNERVKFDKEYLSSLKSELNIYLIGRVVAFQDPIFAKTYNSSAVLEGTTGEIFSMNGQYFLDPSDTKSRNYILNVALEACSLGFDEIQFDYIRYPDSADTKLVFDEVSNFESRTKNINSFLSEATLLLNENGCLVSADIFGYVLQSKSDNGIGQHLESIVSAVNFISPMVYPSHYSKGSFGYANPNEYPYEVVTEALEGGLIRINNNNKIRPYLQGFWHTVDGVKQNIKAAEDKNLHWIIWNNSSMYDIEYFIKLKS